MNMKRMRGRNHRPNNGGGGSFSRNQQNGIPLNRNHVFDSSGPEMRLRGTAQQLHEKYTQLARDASSGGDRVTGEAYYQHAEHYFRIISAINQAQGQPNPAPQNVQQGAYHNGSPGNGQNDYRRPPQPQGNFNGNGYSQEPEAAEPRGFEPRPAPRPDYQERRPERPREMPAEGRYDRPIDISSALEAELEAAVATPAFADQPAAVQEHAAEAPAPAPRSIPIAAAAPEEAAVPAPRRRGRPRLHKPETQE